MNNAFRGMSLREIQKKKKEEWKKNHKILSFLDTCWWFIRHGIWNRIYDYWREVKWGFQRMFRGYDDTAVWSLDSYITDIALPVLKYLRHHGCSIGNVDGWENMSFDEVELERYKVMDKIILAFQIMKDNDMDYEFHNHDVEYYKEQQRKIQEGLQLFAKYYESLWD